MGVRAAVWVVLVVARAAAVAAQAPDPDRTLAPCFFVMSSEPGVDPFPLLSTAVDVKVAGVIADVTVVQSYKNDGTRPIEAAYVFPGSTRAAVYAMKMTIDDRVIVARVQEREAARKDYERAREQGQGAALLEQQRPNVFQMNVANVMPGDRVTVEMSYTELLLPTEGVYEFVYPTVVGPRYSNRRAKHVPASEAWVEMPYLESGAAPPSAFQIQVHLAAGLPIQDVTTPSHRTQVQYDGHTAASVELDPEDATGGNRDFVLRYRLAGGRIETGLLLGQGQGDDENFFLLMVQPPRRVESADVPAREYIFVVDVSGSMGGFPLDVSKRLMRDLLLGLRPSDTFDVLLFAGGSALLSEQPLPATPDNVEDALRFIDRQKGGGGTELLPALRQALALPRAAEASRTVVVLTDGYVTVEPEAFDLIRNRLGDANLFAFGIGTSVNRLLIEGMARVGLGEPFVVLGPGDAAAAARRFRRYVESPVLTRVRLDFGGFDAFEVEPPALPDVLAQRPVLVFGKWRGEARGSLALTGWAAGGPFRTVLEVASARPSPSAAALRYLWARHRIRTLADYEALGSDPRRVKEVTTLGLKYNLLTAYTSFLAVDPTVRNTDARPVMVQQPQPMPAGVSNLAVGGTGCGVCETVSVMASMPSVVQVVTTGMSATMERPQLPDLPLDGRRVLDLLNLAPGAGGALVIDGQPAWAHAVVVDGIDVTPRSGLFSVLTPPLDATEELEVRSHGLPAEDGWSHGTLASVTTQAGNNAGRGTAFLYGSDGSYIQTGGALGGALAKDTLFFFADYQYTRDHRERVWGGTLPSPAFRAGDFSAAPTVVYDPATGRAFPGNRVPAERISPSARRLLDLLPPPDRPLAPPGAINHERVGPGSAATHAADLKLDWNASDGDRLEARASLQQPRVVDPFGLHGEGRQTAWNVGLHYSHVFDANLIGDVRAGLTSYHGVVSTEGPERSPIQIDGFASPFLGLPGGVPWERAERTLQVGTTLTRATGRHTAKAGIEARRLRDAVLSEVGERFSPLGTAAVSAPASRRGLANAFASFLLGLPEDVEPLAETRGTAAAAFVQDEWRATGALTLSAGLRYEAHGQRRGANLGPRLGVSYRVGEHSRLVAGYDTRTVAPHLSDGRLRAWHAGAYQDLPLELVVGVSYVGNRGTDIPLHAGSEHTWAGPEGRTRYDALQVSVDRRVSGDCGLRTTWTLGRTEDDGGGAAWGRSPFDRRHAFAAAFWCGLPFGREADGWTRHLVAGWRLSGIATGQSDGPLVPGDAQLDAALTKRVPGSGQRALELRVEGFNLTNSRRFVGPGGELGRERAVRLGARLTF